MGQAIRFSESLLFSPAPGFRLPRARNCPTSSREMPGVRGAASLGVGCLAPRGDPGPLLASARGEARGTRHDAHGGARTGTAVAAAPPTPAICKTPCKRGRRHLVPVQALAIVPSQATRAHPNPVGGFLGAGGGGAQPPGYTGGAQPRAPAAQPGRPFKDRVLFFFPFVPFFFFLLNI